MKCVGIGFGTQEKSHAYRGKWNETAVPNPWLRWHKQQIPQSVQHSIHIESFQHYFENIPNFSTNNITKISISSSHMLLLLSLSYTNHQCNYLLIFYISEDGIVYSMGEGSFGKLGNCETSSEATFVEIFSDAKDIATGNDFSVILTNKFVLKHSFRHYCSKQLKRLCIYVRLFRIWTTWAL